jgi:hypothetical protein
MSENKPERKIVIEINFFAICALVIILGVMMVAINEAFN